MKLHFLTLTALLLVPLGASALAEGGPTGVGIRDEQGREIVPGGYVAITEDGKGTIQYSPDDYRRMVRMGANFQVIRTALGRLGGWPGREADPTYLARLDAMVRMGREAGLQTAFKLVVYGIKPWGSALIDAVRFANAAAAISVTRLGAQPSAPTRKEIEKLLR